MVETELATDLERFLTAKSIEDVWERLLERLTRFGFHNVLYGYTRSHSDNNFGSHEDHLVLTNLGDAYVQGYFVEARYKHGPIVQWAAQNSGVCSWAHINEIYDDLPSVARETVEFNHKYGVRHGYTIGFENNTKRHKGAIGMSLSSADSSQGMADEIWNKYGKDINLLCGVAHLKIISLPFETRRLTKRQREALEWVGHGKTNAEIAVIMNLTSATVEKHLKLAREVLDVETTAQAVLKASLHNQIYTV